MTAIEQFNTVIFAFVYQDNRSFAGVFTFSLAKPFNKPIMIRTADHPTYIILVNYGRWKDTIDCMQSIESAVSEDVHIIIVDILNLNDSVSMLTDYISSTNKDRCILLELDKNNGFAYACNIGIRAAVAAKQDCFIWLLNNDTLIEKNSLAALRNCFEKNTSAGNSGTGFLGSMILDYHDRDKIQYAGGTIDAKRASLKVTGEGRHRKSMNEATCFDTDWVMGASMFFHSCIIGEIGLMPEDYFLYYEDVEWSLKALRRGYANRVCPESVVIHKQGSSTGQDYNKGKRVDPVSTRYFYAGYIKFFKKNFPGSKKMTYTMFLKQMAGKLIRGDLRRFRIMAVVLLNEISNCNRHRSRPFE